MRRTLDSLRERLWFWPLLLGAAGVLGAELLVRLDRRLEPGGVGVFQGDAEAARAVLSTVATATMTVLGVTLTITLAVLALTAQGYSPRVLPRFGRDRLVQAVIGGFVGTFAFALVALRLVREGEVPGLTVNAVVVLSFAVLALLVAFFHHLATEIRVERIIHAVWSETRATVEGTLDRPMAREDPPPDGPPAGEARAPRPGRVRWVDVGPLAAVARATGGTAVVVAGPGAFVAEGEPLVRLVGGAAPDAGQEDRLASAFEVGTQRSLTQDVAFGLRQLTDIALRALSPSVNDPTTAEEALLRSADILRRVADRSTAARVHDEGGRLLVAHDRPGWDELVGLAFDQVSAAAEAQADAATALVVLDALGRVMAAASDPGRVEVLRGRARRVRDGALRAVSDESERARVVAAAAALA